SARVQALAHGDVEVLGGLGLEGLQHGLERFFREILPLLAESLLDDRLAEVEVLLALLGADEAADARPRLAGDDEPLPGRRRRLGLRGYDLHLVAVLQRRAQGHQAPVDLGADAGVADL